jgi:hypothetical protein
MRTRSAFFAPSRLRPTTSCCDAQRSGLPSEAASAWGRMERETGIEPATNSLEGCDSTTELLPPSCSPLTLARTSARQSPPSYSRAARTRPAFQARSPRSRFAQFPAAAQPDWLAEPKPAARAIQAPISRAKAGGEGRIRTSEAARATDLQSAAFDRSATSPAVVECRRADTCLRPRISGRSVFLRGRRLFLGAYLQNPEPLRLELAEGFEPPTG